MKIAVLGGTGLMASGTIRDLVSSFSNDTIIDEILVCDLSLDKINSLINSLGDERLVAVKFDASNKNEMIKLLEKVDLCINGVPTFAGFQMDIFEACFEAGCKYVDYGGMGVYTIKQKSLHDKWVKAGLTAVLGLGADPGMSNMICKAVAEELDSIESINLYWAATLKGEDSPVLVPPYSVSTIIGEYSNENKQFIDGKLCTMEALSGRDVLSLPEPWGETRFIHSQHSEPLTVPFAKGIADKGIKEMTWRLSLPEYEDGTWRALVRAGFTADADPVEISGMKVNPVEFLEKVINNNIEKNAGKITEQESYEIHLAVGKGTRGGNKVEAVCQVTSGPDPLYEDYTDAGTSMNCSIGAQLLLKNKPVPGVWAPEEYFNVEEYFKEIIRRKFKVSFEIKTIKSF